MANQDQTWQRPILHVSSNTFHQRKCFILWHFSVCLSHSSHFCSSLYWNTIENVTLPRGLQSIAPHPSIRLSVRLLAHPSIMCLWLSRNRKALESSNLVYTSHWTRVTKGVIWGLNVKGQGHWEQKCKNCFCTYICQKWVDLCQTDTKMISSPLYTYCVVYFTSAEMLHVFDKP